MASQQARAQVMAQGVMTGTSTIRSAASSMDGLKVCSYWMAWTGTPNGAFTIFVSNKSTPNNQPPDTSVAANWTSLTLSTAPTSPAGADDQTGVNMGDIAYRWCYCSYTNTSGTGALDIFFQGKN